jgi:hypothetical protein
MVKSKVMAALGIGACAACCAGAIALPWAAGAGFLGLAGSSAIAIIAGLEWLALAAGAIAVGAGILFLYQRRKVASPACPVDGSCGGKSTQP